MPHCNDERVYGVQLGYIQNIAFNFSHVIVEACYDNETDFLVYGRSRLYRTAATGGDLSQLPLSQTQLNLFRAESNRKDNNVEKDEEEVMGVFEVPAELIEELNSKIEYSELASEWATPSATVRSYDTWERYLWNVHKYGFEYFSYDAPRISPNLAPLVQRLRSDRLIDANDEDNSVELYTGYLDEDEVEGRKNKEKVPKYVWLVKTRTTTTTAGTKRQAVVYIVPNGDFAVNEKLCANRCKNIYCCAIGDFVRHVDVLTKIFADDYELF